MPCNQSKSLLSLAILFLGLQFPVLAQEIVGTIQKTGLKPYSIAVYEAQNKVFIADESSGNILVYDGETLSELDSFFVGTLVWAMALDQNTGKLYAGCAPSISQRRIAVIDAKTNTVLRYLEGTTPGDYANLFKGLLQIDAELGKVYALHLGGLTQIDIATDQETKIPGYGGGQYEWLGVNPATHEVFVTRYINNELGIIQGGSLEQTKIPGLGAIGLGVNWLENKVYLSTGGGIGVPYRVYDRDTGNITSVYADNDALGWIFNPGSNRMYTDAEVNAISTVILGADDTFFNFEIPSSSLEMKVRHSTSRIYYAGLEFVGIYDEITGQFTQLAVTNPNPSAIVGQEVAIHQGTGRVYVIHDRHQPFITVVQDAAISNTPTPTASSTPTPTITSTPTATLSPTPTMQPPHIASISSKPSTSLIIFLAMLLIPFKNFSTKKHTHIICNDSLQ